MSFAMWAGALLLRSVDHRGVAGTQLVPNSGTQGKPPEPLNYQSFQGVGVPGLYSWRPSQAPPMFQSPARELPPPARCARPKP